MNKKQHFTDQQWSGLKKLLLVMKLTTFFLCLSVMAMAAKTYAQVTLFDLNVRDATIIQVFDEIERVTEFGFLFKTDQLDLSKHYSLDIKNANIEKILNELLNKDQYSYTIIDRNIVITPVAVNMMQDGNLKKMTGKVTDRTGAPIPGVSVFVKGTTRGVITDADGNYSLSNIPQDAILAFSFIGMKIQEIVVGNKSTLNIVLEEDTIGLEEVVAIGYGTVKKKDLTGSVASVSGSKLLERASFNALQGLQGRAAGVNVVQNTAVPGADPSILIRGTRSLLATNAPLYVVDGMPLAGGIGEISTSDIESMEVLKDASATAIYGSRGANGVIIITTKRGKSGSAQVSYNSYFGVQQASRTIDMMDGAQWVDMVREAYRNVKTGTPYPDVPTLAADQKIGVFTSDPTGGVWKKIEKGYDDQGLWHPENVPYNDWTLATLRVAPIQNHDISIRGGTDKLMVLASANYFNQKGIIIGQDYSRYSARINFDWEVGKNIKIGGQTQYSHYEQNNGVDNSIESDADQDEARVNIYSKIQRNYPLADIYDDAGNLTTNRPGGDPLAAMWNYLLDPENSTVLQSKDRYIGSYYLELKLPFDIKFRSNLGIDVATFTKDEAWGTWSSNGQGINRPQATNGGGRNKMYSMENLLFYNKKFKNHTIGVTLLQSVQQATEETYKIRVKDLPFEEQLWYNVGTALTVTSVGSNYERWRLSSFMGRANYSLMDKYLLTVSARYDGSSRLAPGKKWVLFPSTAFAWRIKEENFLKDVRAISNLKLRLGWGITGNSAIDPYKTQGSMGIGRYNYNATGSLAIYQNEMPNPSLTWEKTSSWNAGIDIGFFNGRVNAVVDGYMQKTSDLLMNRSLPQVSGFASIVDNIGKTQNRGLEVALNTVNVKSKSFQWSTDLTYARNKEKIVELSNGKADDIGNKWFIGQPVKVYYDYSFAGIWQLNETAELAKWGTAFKAGSVKVKDFNGDYKITDDQDRSIIGKALPDFTIGMSNYLNYRNFDFNCSVYGAFGQMQTFNRAMALDGRYGSADVNYWRIIGTDTNGNPISNESNEAPRPSKENSTQPFAGLINYSSASYLRIGQVTLGYTLPSVLLKTAKISKLRLYFSVQNAYVFTSFPGTDPESGRDSKEPTPRTVMVGVNLNF